MPLTPLTDRKGGGVVDCPTQLNFMTWKCQLCSMINTSEKYERTQRGNLLKQARKIAQTCLRRLRVFPTMLMAHFCHKFQFPPLSAAATESVILRKHFEAQSGSLPWLLSLLSPSLSPISFQPDLYLFLILAQRLQRNTLRDGMCL